MREVTVSIGGSRFGEQLRGMYRRFDPPFGGSNRVNTHRETMPTRRSTRRTVEEQPFRGARRRLLLGGSGLCSRSSSWLRRKRPARRAFVPRRWRGRDLLSGRVSSVAQRMAVENDAQGRVCCQHRGKGAISHAVGGLKSQNVGVGGGT
jgi:hypothetical protein